uniref:Aminoacyl-transfer RNA synthetases class-II family profile domain-containing protein n=1 Tax=Panagrolaimus superbus TaxID=310955 RepID=A0A914YDF5_9BILA
MNASLKQISKLNRILKPTQNVAVQGWVEKEYRKGPITFIHVKDGYSNENIQAVIPKEVEHNIGIGSAVEIVGQWRESAGKQQAMELYANKCRIWGKDEGQPLTKNADYIRTLLHLRSKHPQFANILRLRSKVNLLTHQYFTQQNYIYIDTPLISANDCEGAGEAFKISSPNDPDFFGEGDKFLPVSGQLHLEAMTTGIPRVYTLNTAFRAEKSLSRQHLAEFRMLEVERAFTDSVDDLCGEVEGYVKFIATEIQNLFQECANISAFQDPYLENTIKYFVECLETSNFPRLKYDEAVNLLQKHGETVNKGLNKAQELLLVDICKSPIFIYNYPSDQKPFYMQRSENGKEALCFDLLAPFVGELAGGSLREPDVNKMKSRQDSQSLNWYYELRRRGTPQTGDLD